MKHSTWRRWLVVGALAGAAAGCTPGSSGEGSSGEPRPTNQGESSHQEDMGRGSESGQGSRRTGEEAPGTATGS